MGARTDTKKENKIVELRIAGLSPEQVAEKLAIKIESVYYYTEKEEIDKKIRLGRNKRVREKLYLNAISREAKDIELYEKIENGWNPTQKVEQGKPGDFDLSDFHKAKNDPTRKG